MGMDFVVEACLFFFPSDREVPEGTRLLCPNDFHWWTTASPLRVPARGVRGRATASSCSLLGWQRDCALFCAEGCHHHMKEDMPWGNSTTHPVLSAIQANCGPPGRSECGLWRVVLLRSVMHRVFLETATQKLSMEKVNFESTGWALKRGWKGGEIFLTASEILAQESPVLELMDKIWTWGPLLEVVTKQLQVLDRCGWPDSQWSETTPCCTVSPCRVPSY